MNLIKKLYAAVCFVSCLLLIGCFEVEEKTAFKTADRGDYSISLDMGKMLAQIKMFGAGAQLSEMQLKDTTAYLKDILVRDTALSQMEKELIRDGYMQVRINEDKEEMKVIISAPFTNVAQLNPLRNALFKMLASGTKAGLSALPNMAQSTGSLGMLDLNSLGFSLKTEKGAISNTLSNAQTLQTNLEADSALQQFKQLAPLMGSTITYKNVYAFTTPVKDYKAVNGTISDDRKTIIIKNDFNELFENPKAFEYSISY